MPLDTARGKRGERKEIDKEKDKMTVKDAKLRPESKARADRSIARAKGVLGAADRMLVGQKTTQAQEAANRFLISKEVRPTDGDMMEAAEANVRRLEKRGLDEAAREVVAALKPMREESVEQAMEKAARNATAGEAQIELWEIEEKNPEAVKLVRDWMLKWLKGTPEHIGAGYKRLGKVLADKQQFATHV